MHEKRRGGIISMSKTNIVRAVASQTAQPRRRVASTIEAFIGWMTDQLRKGKKVTLSGFGTFRVHHRKARKGRNPRTGEPLIIPSARFVRFKAGTSLREEIR